MKFFLITALCLFTLTISSNLYALGMQFELVSATQSDDTAIINYKFNGKDRVLNDDDGYASLYILQKGINKALDPPYVSGQPYQGYSFDGKAKFKDWNSFRHSVLGSLDKLHNFYKENGICSGNPEASESDLSFQKSRCTLAMKLRKKLDKPSVNENELKELSDFIRASEDIGHRYTVITVKPRKEQYNKVSFMLSDDGDESLWLPNIISHARCKTGHSFSEGFVDQLTSANSTNSNHGNDSDNQSGATRSIKK